MADVLILFSGALIVIAGAVTVAFIARNARAQRRLAEQARPRLLQQRLTETEDFIRRVRQATTDAELDRLDSERKHR